MEETIEKLDNKRRLRRTRIIGEGVNMLLRDYLDGWMENMIRDIGRD